MCASTNPVQGGRIFREWGEGGEGRKGGMEGMWCNGSRAQVRVA